METIKVSSSKLNNNSLIRFPDSSSNSESDIYEISFNGKKKIVKRVSINSGQTFENKIRTVEKLNKLRLMLPSSFCIPESLVCDDEELIGFMLPKVNGKVLSNYLNNKKVQTKDKIEILKQIGLTLEKIEVLRNRKIADNLFISDLHESNIIVNKNKINIVDLDSCKIEDNLASPSKYLGIDSLASNIPNKYEISNYKYNKGYINPSEETDLYCYIIILLNYISGKNINLYSIEEYNDYMNYLESNGIDKELIYILSRIVTEDKNINPYELLDSLNEKQLLLARNIH